MGAKTLPKWSQVGSKIEARRYPKQFEAKIQKVPKTQYVSHFWGVGASKLELSWTKNPPKIGTAGHQKQDEILDGF